ncbi:hypothetical protein OAG89_02845 [Pseudomonadales bacterium]|nr:hypothetical protein [Pseudomonadales bacterium]
MNATEIAEMFGYSASDPDATDKILEDIHRSSARPSKRKAKARFVGGPSGIKCTFDQVKQDYKLSDSEIVELKEYIGIFIENKFEVHHEVNQFITDHKRWGDFPCMRSLNDHGDSKEIPGILPKFFKVVCVLLGVGGDNGAPLDRAQRY